MENFTSYKNDLLVYAIEKKLEDGDFRIEHIKWAAEILAEMDIKQYTYPESKEEY